MQKSSRIRGPDCRHAKPPALQQHSVSSPCNRIIRASRLILLSISRCSIQVTCIYETFHHPWGLIGSNPLLDQASRFRFCGAILSYNCDHEVSAFCIAKVVPHQLHYIVARHFSKPSSALFKFVGILFQIASSSLLDLQMSCATPSNGCMFSEPPNMLGLITAAREMCGYATLSMRFEFKV